MWACYNGRSLTSSGSSGSRLWKSHISESVTIMLLHLVLLSLLKSIKTDEIWEQDLSEDMKIGPTTEGYQRVDLKCSAEHMEVTIVTEDDFDGVIYTRGSFSKQKLPCFRNLKSGTYFRMDIPFDDCLTKNENGLYKNVLIVQHDDDFIMPGDAAFDLECDFRKPKDIPVHQSVTTEVFDVIARIMLSDADPGGKEIPEAQRLKAMNYTNFVTFQPKLIRLQKDEL